MKDIIRDVVRMLVYTVPLAAMIAFNAWTENSAAGRRGVEAERHAFEMLAAAERHNADMHARSMEDRAVIHKIQADVLERLAGVEHRVETAHGRDGK